MPDRPEPDRTRLHSPTTAYHDHYGPGHDSIDNRTPAQKDADKIGSLESKALSSDNPEDRAAALKGIQNEAHDLSKQGLDYAKSVYAELAKRDASTNTVPLVELTDGKMNLMSGDKLQSTMAKEQSNPDVQEYRSLQESLRKDYGLPNSASDKQLEAAEDKKLQADLRKDVGLPATATDKELQAAQDKKLQADLRKDVGLPASASQKQLEDAQTAQLNAELRKDYGLPASATDKELAAAKKKREEADFAQWRATQKPEDQ